MLNNLKLVLKKIKREGMKPMGFEGEGKSILVAVVLGAILGALIVKLTLGISTVGFIILVLGTYEIFLISFAFKVVISSIYREVIDWAKG